MEDEKFVIDRRNESGSGHQEVAVYFPDGYKIRFWKAYLTDEEYIRRAKIIRESEEVSKGIGSEKRVTYQHEDTGNIFTKLIPNGEPIPEFPRRFIVKIEEI
jgi:hypothetical protein